jgi:hypothetical protein
VPHCEKGRIRLNSTDAVLARLREIDWGDLSGAKGPNFLFCVTPLGLGDALPLRALVESSSAHNIVQSEVNGTLSEDGTPDWLGGPIVELTSTLHEDYFEAWQPARGGERIGTLFIYESGIIIARIWILEPTATGEKVFSFMHFIAALRASLRFAGRLYKHATMPIGAVDIRALLVNAEDLDLWKTPGALTTANRRANRDVGRILQLPNRPFSAIAGSLEAEADEISQRLGRSLLDHYGAA